MLVCLEHINKTNNNKWLQKICEFVLNFLFYTSPSLSLALSPPLSVSLLVFVSCSCVRQLFRIWFRFECGCQAPKRYQNCGLFYCGLLFYCVCVLLFLCLFLNTHFTFRRRQQEREIILFEIFNLVVYFLSFFLFFWLIWFLQDSRYVACCLWRHYKYPREM